MLMGYFRKMEYGMQVLLQILFKYESNVLSYGLIYP